MQIERRVLGENGPEISVIGLGTWAMGGDWAYGWGPQQEQDSIATIQEALSLGINWIDTAPAYGLGRAEEVVGRAVRDWVGWGNERPLIATKCGLVPAGEGKVDSILKRDSIRKECEDSLKRLGVEQIDLYQIHWPNPAGDIGEAFQTLLDLQKQGKVRWIGVSNFSVAQMEHIRQYGSFSSLQPPYSMVNRGIEDGILSWCQSHQVGVIPYSPLQCGLLTGKVTAEWVKSLPESDWRKTKSDFFREPRFSRIMRFISELGRTEIGKAHPLSEIAIQWILKRQGITAPICGARRPGQIGEIVSALSWKMNEREEHQIDALYTELVAA